MLFLSEVVISRLEPVPQGDGAIAGCARRMLIDSLVKHEEGSGADDPGSGSEEEQHEAEVRIGDYRQVLRCRFCGLVGGSSGDDGIVEIIYKVDGVSSWIGKFVKQHRASQINTRNTATLRLTLTPQSSIAITQHEVLRPRIHPPLRRPGRSPGEQTGFHSVRHQ